MAVPMMGSLSVEDFSSWFKSQEAATRLDIVNAILQMLHPLELRFIASCVEDLTRKDYNIFRESENRYNGENFAGDFFDLTRPFCRGKLLVALSLLYSNNYVNACIMYRTLLSLYSLLGKLPVTKQILDEVLLLFSMAKYHPAFRFDQRATIADLTGIILRFMKQHLGCETYAEPSDKQTPSSGATQQIPESSSRTEVNSCGGQNAAIPCECDQNKYGINAKNYVDSGSQTDDVSILATPEPTPLPCIAQEGEARSIDQGEPDCSKNYAVSPPIPEHTVTAGDVVVVGVKRTGGRNCIYDVRVLWSNGEETTTAKSNKDWYKFHNKILNLWPIEAGVLISDRQLPYFPVHLGDAHEESDDAVLISLNAYLQQLKLLPLIFLSDCMTDFLKFGSNALTLDGRVNHVEFTDFNELSPISDEAFSGYTRQCSSEEPRDNLRSPPGHSFHDGDGGETVDIDADGPDQTPVVSSASYPGSFTFYSRGPGHQFLHPPPFRSSYDVFHPSLTTALLIVRPNSTSPSLDKILQTNLLVSRENSRKFLANGIDEVEPSSNETGAYVSNNCVG